MKVVVNYDLCESNAVCMGIAPEVFEVRDDDFLYLLDEHPPDSMRPKIDQHRRRLSASRTQIARSRPSQYGSRNLRL
jgi:ferredoxin